MSVIGHLGPMNSMKSAMAIMNAHKYMMDGETFIAFKSARDTRDGAFIVSRAIRDKVPCNLIGELESGNMYRLCQLNKPEHVIVDEVQFLPPNQIEELIAISGDLGIEVECYGLKLDFQTKLFPGSKRLIELADQIKWIESDCSISGCRNQATQNMRLDNGTPIFHGEQIQVGREESYKAVCTYHYLTKKAEVNGI